MKEFIFIVLIALFSVYGVLAQTPELVDRELYFGNPEISGAQLSPDGKFLSFMKPLNGTRNVYVKKIDEPFDAAKPLTNETKRPVGGYFWSNDAKYILFVKDKDGDENFNVYAVNPAEAASGIPTARALTTGKNVRAMIYAVPETDPDAIFVGINDRDEAWHDLYKVKISTGEKTLIRKNTDRLQGWLFDNADNIRLATRSAENGDTETLRVEADGKFTKIYSCNMFESCGAVRFHKDNKRVYFETNKGDRDLTQLVLLDPITLKEELVEQDPLARVDFGGAQFSEVTKEMVATTYEDDKTRVYFKEKSYEKDYKKLKKMLGNREISFQSLTKDEQTAIVVSYSDVEPGTVWLFDRKTGKLTTLYQTREKLNRASLSPMTPIRYKSSDGLEIPAYLTIPKSSTGKNLPLVVVPHGGPWARDSWGYNGYAQFLSNRGYAVLQPNFRASTGYGKKFLNAGNGQWGQLMQDDITWGVKHLVANGTVDANRVAILGGSYGGYATLAGVTYTPDTYKAAVAIVAPSNLLTLLNSIPPYWEAIRKVFHTRMGDPTTPEGKAQLERQSPLNSADKIKTPLMIVQGANDPRVKKAEADQIVVALRDRNYPVEYICAPDEGHGFQRPVNNMAMFMSVEKFLAKHLGGRYQEGGPADVVKRLGEITVDPKTVTLKKAADTSVAPSIDLTGKWSMTVDAGGQTIPMTLEINQTGGTFSGSSSSMLGNATVENGSVFGNNFKAIVKANVQGQSMEFAMEGTMADGKLSGNMSGPGLPPLAFTATKAQ